MMAVMLKIMRMLLLLLMEMIERRRRERWHQIPGEYISLGQGRDSFL